MNAAAPWGGACSSGVWVTTVSPSVRGFAPPAAPLPLFDLPVGFAAGLAAAVRFEVCMGPLEVDGAAERRVRRFEHGLGQRGVGVDGVRQLLGGALGAHRDAGLSDEVGR